MFVINDNNVFDMNVAVCYVLVILLFPIVFVKLLYYLDSLHNVRFGSSSKLERIGVSAFEKNIH